jgi:hypothetical protein
MSTMTTRNWDADRGAVATAIALPAQDAGASMRDAMVVVRDTIIVLAIQLAFRAGLMLRRWNY